MTKRLFAFAIGTTLTALIFLLGGCALPNMVFKGGPSPWLPGGAPDRAYPAAYPPVPGAPPKAETRKH